MNLNDKQLAEFVYEQVCGYWNTDDIPLLLDESIEDEFADDHFCAQAYERVLDAYDRLYKRLGNQNRPDDEDVEIIINEMMSIEQRIAMAMFSYGLRYGRGELK